MPDAIERFLRTVGEVFNESMQMVKQFIFLVVVVFLLSLLLWIPVYVALGGGF